MATNSYDMLVEIDEKLLNKAMAMAYYAGFIKFEGDYNLVTGVPDELQGFTRFHYKLVLNNEPFVDLRGKDEVNVRLSGAINLVVFGGIPINLDVELSVKTIALFDMAHQNLNYKVEEVKIIRLVLNDKIQMHKNFVGKLNEIFGILLNDYFKNGVKTFHSGFVLQSLSLPMMPVGDTNKLPVSQVDVQIVDNRTLTVGINFFTNTCPVNLSGLYNNGKELYFGFKETALNSIFDFWWSRTTFNKSKEFTGQTSIGFDSTLEKSVDLATRVLSLGFIESDTNYENVVLDYGGKVSVTQKPEFDFQENNVVKISKLVIQTDLFGSVTADVYKDISLDTSSFIPDSITPWNDDIKLKNINKRKEIASLKDSFDIDIIDAEGKIAFNDDNNLVVKIVKADFSLDFKHKTSGFSKRIWDKLIAFIKDRLIEKIPEIVLSPSLVLSKIDVFDFTGSLNQTEIKLDSNEFSINTNIIVNELRNLPVAVPLYIANEKTKVIHKLECPMVSDIDPENRVGYFVIYEALSDKYKACKACLNAYHIN